jgi:hypothetical protein
VVTSLFQPAPEVHTCGNAEGRRRKEECEPSRISESRDFPIHAFMPQSDYRRESELPMISPAGSAPSPTSPRGLVLRGVTARAVLLGLLLIPVNVYWVIVIEVRWYALDGSCLPLFITPVFMLFCLCLLNLVWRRLHAKSALSPNELLTVYLMLVASGAVCGHDMVQNLFGVVGHFYWFASSSNRWDELFGASVPRWLTVQDEGSLKGFYGGKAGMLDPGVLDPWIVPLLWWAALILVMIAMMLCAGLLVRKLWTEDEKLSYPLIQLPLQMTGRSAGAGLFGDKLMWAGFAVAAFFAILNGLHVLYPQVPEFKYVKQYDVGQHFTGRPWDGLQGTRISMYPFAIGWAFFLPSDLSFSCWFFFVVRLIEKVIGRAAGWDQGGQFPYFNQQSAGAWLTLAFLAAYGARHHLAEVARAVLGRPVSERIDRESGIYRLAVAGLVLGAAFILWFCARAGMTLWAAALFFGLFFALSLAMTRVRAELGTPHEIYFVNPQEIMVGTLGTPRIGAQNMTVIATMYWFNRCYRCHPMPNQMEALKMGQVTGMGSRRVVAALFLATVAALFFTYWSHLSLCFREGALAKCVGFKQWVGWESYNRLATWLNVPQSTNATHVKAMVVGAGLVATLRWLRTGMVSFPFHPAGYALAISFAMDYFWFAFFISWALKAAIVRYTGMTGHRKAIPFFTGLILGDYVVGSLWAIIGPVLGKQTYKVFI